MKKKMISAIVICIMCMATSIAQTSKEIDPSKVESLDAILASLYDVVSGEKSKERNWELLKYLCQDDAKLIFYAPDDNGKKAITYLTIDGYVNMVGDYFSKNDFFEKEIHRTVDTFGPITQVFSTYESYNSETNKVPFARGINSIQLLNDGERWWIVNVYWTSESETNPIPKRFLPKS
ncbi:hypothetical protein N9954_02135 [Maribacter sp.]|nr:hypothetical protein [Maribacter sp.]